MSFAVAAAVTAGVGLAKLGVSLSGRKKRIEEQKKAKAEMEQKKKAYEALDTSNVYKNMENKMEDLTINQKGMQLQPQQGQQQRANIMQQMKEIDCIEFDIGDIVRSGLLKSYLINKIKLGLHYEA